jgi:hypothetical protein
MRLMSARTTVNAVYQETVGTRPSVSVSVPPQAVALDALCRVLP